VDVKKEKRKKKGKKYIVKVNVCACICFIDVIFFYECFFMIKSQRIKKNLIF
jgi:hypothetical protein